MTVRVLIADDERAARFGMTKALAKEDCCLLEAEHGEAALATIRNGAADLVFLDLNMPVLDGLGVLKELGGDTHNCEIIVVTANDSVRTAVECMRLGAADYITKPYELEQVRAIVRRVARRLSLEQRIETLQSTLDQKQAFGALVGMSRPMQELYQRIERAAKAPLDVLIRGETGTGKELIARELHRLSGRKGPFIAVNTAAIAESLAESELFGHRKGAFTGAHADHPGVFEQAHGGTVFLDEIGDMPANAQAKILRVLQERVVQPVGTTKGTPVDVRVISATHQDLRQAIEEGNFRKDLWFRIRGVELTVPPLRDRREDILVLANYFLDQLASKQPGVPRPTLAADAIERLLRYVWPGNVRELQQTITAAATMTTETELHARDLELGGVTAEASPPIDLAALAGLPLTAAKEKLIESFERLAIEAALDAHQGNISRAARQLGIHRQSLQQKLTQLGIHRGTG